MATAMVTVPRETQRIRYKIVELGRIRIGDTEESKKTPGTFFPHKLTKFRLTSSNGSLLQYAARLYKGEVHPWVGERAPVDEHGRPTHFELYTEVSEMNVIIPTASAISVLYEKWTAAGCSLRCNGCTILEAPLQESLVGQPCQCPEDEYERERLAKLKKPQACGLHCRLNILLPDLPGGMGVWRLETQGKQATNELTTTLAMLIQAGQEHDMIEAILNLEQRTTKRPGEGQNRGTLHYVVPVLMPIYTPRQLLAKAQNALLGAAPAQAMLAAGERTQAAIYDLTGNDAPVSTEPVIELMSREEFTASLKHIWQAAQLSEAIITEEKATIAHSYGGTVPVQAYAAVVAAQRAKYPPRDPETGERIPDDLGQTSGHLPTDPSQADLWEGEEAQDQPSTPGGQ